MRWVRQWIGVAAVLGVVAGAQSSLAQSPPKKADPPPTIIPVKKQDRGGAGAEETPQRPEQTPEQPQAPQAPAQPSAPAASTTTPAAPTSAPASAPAEAGPAASSFNSGNIAAAPTSDLAAVFNNSSEASGVEIQRRNTIVADPRVRGYRVGQLATWGDHAFFFPARLDMDTAISKFEPGSILDITVIKGPYATRYGPGFAFLDIVTFDTPRAKECREWELHGRTQLGYQTNGQRWDGLQSVEYGARDWGFRASYNIMVGNDYENGDGVIVPSSYNSQNINFAVGLDLSPKSSLEFKALRQHQHDLEFAGLYFDIRKLDTEAYSLRFTSKESPYYDLLTADVWYNTTLATGDTQQSYRQTFLKTFLPQTGFGVTGPGGVGLANLTDQSTTRFSERSIGYRLAAMYGHKDSINFTIGTDFTFYGQGQTELIRILDPDNRIAADNTGLARQELGLPDSKSYDTGLFVEANLPVNDRLSFRSGARADYVRTETGFRRITGNIDLFGGIQFPGPAIDRMNVDPLVFSIDPTNAESSRDFGLWSTFVSSEYKFDDALTGIMGFGYARRAPTLTELYSTGPFVGVLQPGFDRLIGDPHLSSEKLKQFDLGLRADYGWCKGSVNGFYAWIDDYITYDRNKFGDSITQVTFTNTDRATLAGGEMYGQVEATCWLTPFGSLSYVEGRDLAHRDNRRRVDLVSSRRAPEATETEPLPSISPLEIRTGMRVHQSVDHNQAAKWSVEVAARCVFDQELVAASLGERTTPGFTVWDLRSYWQATEKLTLTAGVENFGDRIYREHLDSRAGNLFYRPGVNFYFTTQLKY